MYKVVVVLSIIAVANAGLLGAPIAYSSHVIAAPIAAPLIKTAVPVATSYQNTFKISRSAIPVVAAAPIVKAAPLAFAPAHFVAAPAIAAPILKSPIW